MNQRYQVGVIALVLLFYCFAFQGMRGLFEPDEGRYSAVALQMIRTGDWIAPRTHPDQEHWAKPPLAYWAIAASLLTFGQTEFAVRFPNALSFFLTIIISYFLGRIFTPRRPWLVPLIFGTFLFPATMCNGATTDFPVMMWETLAVYCFSYLFWSGKVEFQALHEILMWVFFSLAFLTKGPPGILPLLPIVVFCLLKGPKMRHVPVKWGRGVLIFLILGGSWYWFVIGQNFGLARYFLWDEIILRMFSGYHQRHVAWYSFLYIYVPVLVFGSLPWSLIVWRGLKNAYRTLREELFRDRGGHSYQNTFLLLWTCLPLAVFIVSRSNLPLYVLPLFVPVAVLTAKECERREMTFKPFKKALAAWCLMIVLVRPLMSLVPFGKDSSAFAEAIRRKYPISVEEIVFVNTRPALGLTFYTGSDIQYLPMQFNDIQNELRENKSRIWAVLEDERDEFLKNIQYNNDIMIELGPIKAWQPYVLFRQKSATI